MESRNSLGRRLCYRVKGARNHMKKIPEHSLGFWRERKTQITNIYEIKAELLEYVHGKCWFELGRQIGRGCENTAAPNEAALPYEGL